MIIPNSCHVIAFPYEVTRAHVNTAFSKSKKYYAFPHIHGINPTLNILKKKVKKKENIA